MNIYVTSPYTSTGLKGLLSFFMTKSVSPLSLVNEAREDLFCQKNRDMDRIPPTRNAPFKRAIFQAGVWTVGTEAEPVIPYPDDFAWTKDESTNLWVPV